MTKIWSLNEAIQILGDETKSIPVEFQQLVDEMRGSRKSAVIFLLKYCMTDDLGNLLEYNKETVWKRIIKNIPNLSDEEKTTLFEALVDNCFVPGGRIISALGSSQKVSPYNCYVLPAPDDTIDSIFNTLRDMAKTMSKGGGVGLDLSNLRPAGIEVSNSAKTSTGPVSFMNLFSEVTKTIGQNNRRGALMLTMRVDHPDIVEFINSKYFDEKDIDNAIVEYVRGDISLSEMKHRFEGLYKVNFANISIKLTDAFMKAVEKDDNFELWWEGKIKGETKRISKIVKARTIWDLIISRAWATAEPGVLFWDRIVEEHNGEYFAKLSSTNPCAEEPLPGYSCCNLAHINLSAFVEYPFTHKAIFNFEKFTDVVELGVKFLNAVIDYRGSQALKEFDEYIPKERRIGLGITGMADMFVKLGCVYGDKKSKNLINEIMSLMAYQAYRTSINLAMRDGAFEQFDYDKFIQSTYMQRVIKDFEQRDSSFLSDLKKYGIRNVTLLSIAPVGTGSEITNGGISSGIEPIFAKEFTRRVKINNEYKMFTDYPAIVREYRDLTGSADFPKNLIVAHDIPPDTRISLQSIIQQYVDAAISSTINLDSSVSTSDIEKIYFNAWKSGLKGITIYREGSREGILLTNKVKNKNLITSLFKNNREMITPIPTEIDAKVFSINYKPGYKARVTITHTKDGSPLQVLVITKAPEDEASAKQIGMLITGLLRKDHAVGLSSEWILNELREIRDNTTVLHKDDNEKYPVQISGLAQAVAYAMSLFYKKYKNNQEEEKHIENKESEKIENDLLGICPQCMAKAVKKDQCEVCLNCGWTKCI
jgi:ribonucleoside-diphosphate reductase alpha chain